MEKRDPNEIWIKPAQHGRLTKISTGFRWTPEERRLLWITAIGGAIGSLVTLLVVGLAVAIDRWKPPGGKAREVHDQNIEQIVLGVIIVGLLASFALRGWRRRQPFDRSFHQWQRFMWLALAGLVLLALVGRAAGIH